MVLRARGLGSSPLERFQFKPAEPLALGEHQVEVRISPIIAGDDSEPEDVLLRFMVSDLPYQAGDVEPIAARRPFTCRASRNMSEATAPGQRHGRSLWITVAALTTLARRRPR